jgi:wyosine [tRNA(Phe)-imidazoG37] synthetase (radical SAM superfamily)
MSVLFDDIIFGPVRSRRLGISLGINLLPEHTKYCTFNCIYCECGWTKTCIGDAVDFHTRKDIAEALERSIKDLSGKKMPVDALTFAGNGEPTVHPEFAGIIDDTLELGKKFFPASRVVVLSNSTTLNNESVFNALLKVDNIMKLDAGSEEMYRTINNPMTAVTLADVVAGLRRFKGQLTIQTLLLNGSWQGKAFDNTGGEELEKWLGHISLIKPRLVMLYPVDRPSPARNIEKVNPGVMESIAGKVRSLGVDVKIYS